MRKEKLDQTMRKLNEEKQKSDMTGEDEVVREEL